MRGFGGLVLLVLVIGTVLRYWVAIAVAAGIIAALLLLWWFTCRLDRWLDAWDARRARARAALAAIAHRADIQHAQVLAGDERGIHGDYPSKQID